MYRVGVPISSGNRHRLNMERALEELKKLDATRVYLGLGVIRTDPKERAELISDVKQSVEFFHKHGYEVGAWLWTFWLRGRMDFTPMRSNSGVDNYDFGEKNTMFACPSDEDFRKYAAEYVRDLAECGVDFIQFDDDFRYGHLMGGFCCLCENHLKWISDDLGEEVTEEFLVEKLTKGGENKYRDSWLRANGYFMELYAKEMREAVDSVNPNIRMGRCACMTSWDMDGTDPVTIGRLLAGNTKPFIRLIGAPYWAVNKSWGNRVQDVIELERMETSWMADSGFEIFSEGDVWPRPRWNCPAAFLEGYDTALRADGTLDGILKYGIDYTGSIDYELGYAERHIRNRKLYNEIEKNFADKTAIGVRVYEAPKKYAKMVIPKKIEGGSEIQDYFFPIAARVLAENTILTTWYGDGICGIAFGENARHLPENAINNGLILDACAARILMEKGIDVGISEFISEEVTTQEYHIDEDEYTSCVYDTEVYRVKLKNGAVVKSEFFVSDGVNMCGTSIGTKGRIPASYTYENADGQRFFVYTADAYYNQETLWRNHVRGAQLAKAIEWLSGEKLPATCHKNPDLYMMCKVKNGEMAVGLWNFCIDSILSPEITLSKSYKKIKFINCKGKMKGNKVYLSEIAPFGFAGIVLR